MHLERVQATPATGSVAFFTPTGLVNSDANFAWDATNGLSLGVALALLNAFVPTGAHGETATLQWVEELLTLSTSGATTDTVANLLPAGAIILAVTARVTTTITTATDWKLGDATTAGRFSAADSTMTANETAVGILHWSGAVTTLAAGPSQAAAAKVRVTTTGTPGAGAIRIGVLAYVFAAPTS